MSFAMGACTLALLASGILGCEREPSTQVNGPSKTDVPSAFNGAKAGGEREVAGVKLCWCPAG